MPNKDKINVVTCGQYKKAAGDFGKLPFPTHKLLPHVLHQHVNRRVRFVTQLSPVLTFGQSVFAFDVVNSANLAPSSPQPCQVSFLLIGCLRPNALHLSPAPTLYLGSCLPQPGLPDCLLSCEPSTLPLVPHFLFSVTCADSTCIPLLHSIECSPAHVFRFRWLHINALFVLLPWLVLS